MGAAAASPGPVVIGGSQPGREGVAPSLPPACTPQAPRLQRVQPTTTVQDAANSLMNLVRVSYMTPANEPRGVLCRVSLFLPQSGKLLRLGHRLGGRRHDDL